jgi:phospholipase/lecithinase/hemolysin
VESFAPDRVIAFGDESSVIVDVNGDANGRKYTVDATVSATDATLDCKLNPIWIQVLARAYGFVFPQCNPGPNAVAAPQSRIRAVADARVAGLAAQIDAQLAESPLNGKDLVTVYIGQNDVLDEYAKYPTVGEAQLIANLEAIGTTLGQQINRIADTGAKVVLATVPDVGATPFGLAEKTAHTDIDRAALLTRLTARFNAGMRQTIYNDGRKIGLILADEYFNAVVRIVNAAGFVNVTAPVCDLPALPAPEVLNCTNLTLVSGGSPSTWLWADNLHFSPGGHLSLGNLAITRAQNNPF